MKSTVPNIGAMPIYLDNHATTPTDPAVVEAMLPYFTERFGNIASTHRFGRELQKPVAEARGWISKLVNCKPDEIVFTSGATESNNLALRGVAEACGGKGHIITCQTEHKCVLNTCTRLEELGFDVTYLGVDQNGQIDLQELKSAIRHSKDCSDGHTVLVSIMYANNEIGTLQPVQQISDICRAAGVLFHVDAAQAVGKIPVDVTKLGAQFVSFTAHKMYGPKGIGALYIRKSDPCAKLACQMSGGGQEGGYRSGTLPVPLVVAFGKACELAVSHLKTEGERLGLLRDRLLADLRARLGDSFIVNGHPTERLPGNLHISVPGVDPELLGISIKDIAVSSGSACSSAKPAASHVLKALGHSDELALASVRFGIGRFNTVEHITAAATHIGDVISKLRKSGTGRVKDAARQGASLTSRS